jgi:hypothetical protein
VGAGEKGDRNPGPAAALAGFDWPGKKTGSWTLVVVLPRTVTEVEYPFVIKNVPLP